MIITFPAQDDDSQSHSGSPRRDRQHAALVKNVDTPPRTHCSSASTSSELMLRSWESDSSSSASDHTPTCERAEEVPLDATPPSLRIQRSGSGWWDEPRTPTSAASLDESRIASLQVTPSSAATDFASDACATSGSSALSSPGRGVSNWRIEQILADDEADAMPSTLLPQPASSSPPPSPLRKNSTGWWNVEARPTRRAAHISWTRPPPPTFNSRLFLPETVDAMVRHKPKPRCVSWHGA